MKPFYQFLIFVLTDMDERLLAVLLMSCLILNGFTLALCLMRKRKISEFRGEIEEIERNMALLDLRISELPETALLEAQGAIDWWKSTFELYSGLAESLFPREEYEDWTLCKEKYLERYGTVYGAIQSLYREIEQLQSRISLLEEVLGSEG